MNSGVVQQPDFGQRLKQLREEAGLSQRDVAGNAVNPSYVSLLESGARVPTLEVVVRLAEALNVSTDTLIGASVVTSRSHTREADRFVSDLIARTSLDYGDLPEAQVRYEQAYRNALEADSVVLALEYGLALQEILHTRSCDDERYDLVLELDELATRVDVVELRVKVETERAAAARETGRGSEAVEFAERAAKRIIGTQLEGTAEHVRLLGVLVSVRCEFGDMTEIAELIDRIVAVADDTGCDGVRGRAHWVAAVAYARMNWAKLAEEHIRLAKGMLGTPGTPLREWARFSRAAASTLLDAGGDLDEIGQYLGMAETTLRMVSLPGEEGPVAVLKVRHAVAEGDGERALQLAKAVPKELSDSQRIRLRIAIGRAHHALGDTDRAITELRAAAELAEEHCQFRLATTVWREIDSVRSR